MIDEFCRAQSLRPEVFRRMQRLFASEIQAQLDERDQLLVRVAALEAENAALKADQARGKKREAVSA